METAAPANANIGRRRGGTPLAANERKPNRKQLCNSLKINDRRKFGPLQIDKLAAINWRSRFNSPFPCFLTTSSRTLRQSHSNRNNTLFKNVRNPLSPNEKAFSNRNSKSLFPIRSPLRLNWRGTVESVKWLKALCEANHEKFSSG